MKKVLLSLVLVVAVSAAPALAVMNEGEGEIGFGVGSTDVDGFDRGDHFALRGGYAFSDHIELEGQYSSTSADADIQGINFDASMNLLMVNGLYNFHPREKITPFLLVGLGMADVDIDFGGLSIDDSGLAYQVGGGTRIFFGEQQRAALRFDVSLVSEDTFDDRGTHTNVTGGFTWRFGN